LLNPSFDFRTVNGIARSAHLPETFVSTVLEELGLVRGIYRWWNAPTVY
jgi:hypothetical protein